MNFDESVIYLESEDFSDDGKLKVLKDKPVVILLGGNFCGFCKAVKPIFQTFSTKVQNVYPACILIDGSPSERQLNQKMGKWLSDYKGVPTVIAYKNGKYLKTYDGPRTEQGLLEFAKGL